VYKAVFEFGWVACASTSYIAAHGSPTSAEELAKHSVIRYADAMHRAAGPRWLEENRGCARVSIVVDNTEVAGHSVASGSGVGVIPVFVEQGRPAVVRVFPKPVASTTGYLVYHESVRDTAKIRAALAQLSSVFEQNDALLRSWRGTA
jgi:DNA-binding transcriptional LysR family regulator